MTPSPAPYGTWETIITEDYVINRIANTIDEVLVDPKKLTVYCLESRPKEEGRGVLVRLVGADSKYDVTDPKEWNVRTGVHEYGGTAAAVFNGTAYFSNYSFGTKIDGRVYKVEDNGPSVPPPKPTPITPLDPENDKNRFAGLAVYPKDPNFIVAIRENHPDGGPPKVANTLCVINAKEVKVDVIISGQDATKEFYGPPAFSPSGEHIAWQNWSHPDMPWDQSKIYIANVSADSMSLKFDKVRAVPLQYEPPLQVSLACPNWSNDQTLIFTSDVSGFINPWKYDVSTDNAQPSPVFSKAVTQDFGCPMWSLHFFPFTVLDEQRALFIGTEDGHDSLYFVDLKTSGSPIKLDTGYVIIDGLRSLGKENGNFKVVFAGTKVDEETKIIYIIVPDSRHGSLPVYVTTFESPAMELEPDIKEWISTPDTKYAIHGYDGPVHVVYYAPTNPNYSGLPGEKPPCIVHVHGGPEWLQPQGLDWTKQYFTSRGYAWLDVNYGGSSGYGRKYRERLRNRWGVVDTDDCITSVQQLSARYGLIDPEGVCIRGGSAGGLTTYSALSYGRYKGIFAAGTSIYGGVANLKSLATKTHKFELYYTDKFVGGSLDNVPWIYEQRSPLTYAEDISVPLMILHGDKDPVVPVEQAWDMFKRAGVRANIQIYKGEGHHIGQADHIKDALQRERDCYERALRLKGLNAI